MHRRIFIVTRVLIRIFSVGSALLERVLCIMSYRFIVVFMVLFRHLLFLFVNTLPLPLGLARQAALLVRWRVIHGFKKVEKMWRLHYRSDRLRETSGAATCSSISSACTAVWERSLRIRFLGLPGAGKNESEASRIARSLGDNEEGRTAEL